MTLCARCRQELPGATARWGRLVVTDSPPAATWDGRPIRLKVLHARILWHLARHGSSSREQLEGVAVGPDALPNTLDQQLRQLRPRIRPFGFTITALRGWGQQLALIEEGDSR